MLEEIFGILVQVATEYSAILQSHILAQELTTRKEEVIGLFQY
jgi:hypothetical protein